MFHLLLLILASTVSGRVFTAESEAEPKPATVHFREDFEDARLLDRGWYDGSKFSISEDKPNKGKGSIEFAWKAGETTPGGVGGVRRLFEPGESVYIRFYLRLSKGWKWSGKGFHPHLIQCLTTENEKFAGPAATHLTVYVEPVDGKLRLAAQDIQNKDQPHGLTQGSLKGGYNGTMWDSKEDVFKDDEWHCIEAFFKLNSLDVKGDEPVKDGIVQGWFDGKLVIDRSDVILRSTDFPKMKFNQFLLAPYFGPGLLQQAQTLWVDDLSVGDRREEKKE